MFAAVVQRPIHPFIHLASTLMCATTLAAMTSSVRAEIVFDASPSVACRDVTPSDFELAHPGEKMVEARVQISTLIYRGGAEQLDELIYQFTSPERSMQVVDYLPKTTLATDYAGNITVEQTGQQTNGLTIGASGHFNGIVDANIGANDESVRGSTVNYEMLPPQELVAASGTINRGTGVYFKLRHSPQLSLEGSREFVLLLAVPQSWRGDYLRVVCEARGKSPTKTSAFLVPLYALGDRAAQTLADELGQAERQFLHAAQSNVREVSKRSQPTLAHELSLVEPRIPADWLARLAHRPITSREPYPFERYLPADIQQTATAYHLAKQNLHAVRGHSVATTLVPDSPAEKMPADKTVAHEIGRAADL